MSADAPKRILVVDDDPVIRNLICTLLNRKRYVCSQAVNGAEILILLRAARTSAQQMPYDLIILDMMMPMVSGWDVLAMLEGELPDFKRHVIILSAAGAQLDGLTGHGYGAVIEKPFDADVLFDAVNRCVRDPHPVSRTWPVEPSSTKKAEAP